MAAVKKSKSAVSLTSDTSNPESIAFKKVVANRATAAASSDSDMTTI